MHSNTDEQAFLQRVTSATIRVVLLGAWLVWCLQIVLPFAIPIVWGAIIATTVLPLTRRVVPTRPQIGALGVGAIGLALILVPSWLVLGSVGELAIGLGKQMASGELKIPPPRAEVAEWPLIGTRVHALWHEAFSAPKAALEAHIPQLRQVGRWLMGSLGALTLGILQSLFAVVLAAAFVAKAEATHRALVPVAERLAPRRGAQLIDLAASTVRGVAKGVLGVAAIQALLAFLGMVAAGVPGAGALSLLVLIGAVAQLPTLLILVPIALYVSSFANTSVSVAFLLWSLLVGVSDNILKPLLLGRGASVPTLVIVIGAIGGMISAGIVGLFVGAVVLAVGYALFSAWVQEAKTEPPAT